MTNPDSVLKQRNITLLTKVCLAKAMVFSSSHIWMWELDYKESWALKNWCFWTVVLENNLESPLDCKEIQPVNPEGNQSWIFTGRTDAEAETLASWWEELTHLKRPWCWERLKAREEWDNKGWDGWMASPTQRTWVEWTPGVGDGQGGLVCCRPWGPKSRTRLTELTDWLIRIIFSLS